MLDDPKRVRSQGVQARRGRQPLASGMPLTLLALIAVGLAACGGCVPSPGPFALAAAEGRVVDRDSGNGIPEAWVVQWYKGGGVPGASQPEYHARFARTDAAGQFRFEREVAPSPRMWLLRTYGPSYSFFHPSYGLLHGGVQTRGAIELSGSLRDAELRRADLAPYCQGRIEGAGARRLAELACGP